MEMLLGAGAEVDSQNEHKATALHIAAERGTSYSLLQRLILKVISPLWRYYYKKERVLTSQINNWLPHCMSPSTIKNSIAFLVRFTFSPFLIASVA